MAYNGHIAEIPVGFGGLTGSKNQSKIRPDQLLAATNISYANGNLTKEGGAAKYNSTAITGAPKVIGGFDWWPLDGVQRMIVATDDGKLLRDDGSGAFGTTLASGLTMTENTPIPLFVEGGKEQAAGDRKLFIFTGLNAVQVLSGDGATTAALATPPADWAGVAQPTFGLIHEGGRLWAGGNSNDPHRLYYSTTASQEDFTGAGSGSISVYPGEGEKLVGALSFKGLIVAYKFPKGIYLIDTSNPTVANWRVRPLTRAIGSTSSMSAVAIDDDVLFIDASCNFHLASAVTAFGDVGSRNLSAAAQIAPFIQENVNRSQLSKARAIYYADQREAHFVLPGRNSVEPDRRIVVDFNLEELPRFRFSDRDVNHALWLRKDTNDVLRPIIGSDAGFVWLLDQETKTKDGAPYMAHFQTAHMDMAWLDPALATKNKLAQFLELVVEPTGNWDLSVDVLWDGKVASTVQFHMGSTGVALGSFVLGTDMLGGGALLNRKHRITGSGRRVSLSCRNAGAGEDFSASRFYLYFKTGDEKVKE